MGGARAYLPLVMVAEENVEFNSEINIPNSPIFQIF